MRRVGPALAVSLLSSLSIAACDPGPADPADEGRGASETGKFATGSYRFDPETGETRAVVNNEDGTTTMSAGERVVPQLPEGFGLYPGAEIRNTVQVGRNAASGAVVSLASADRPADLVGFYRRQAEAAGIAIELDLQTEAMTMIAGEAPDGTFFAFQASSANDETGATIGQLTVRRGLN